MQLRSRQLWLLLVGSCWLIPSLAAADTAQIDAYSTLFYEFGGPLEMLVVNPHVNLRVDPAAEVRITASYEADIVSGASVAVVDAPTSDVDVISSATRLDDVRSVVNGGLQLNSPFGTLRGSYAYGFESDYTSHSFTIGARSEVFERNTTFDLSYARGFDSVCDLNQPRAQEAVERRRLDISQGCFDSEDMTRVMRDLSLQTFQGSWTQAWTPIFVTQVTLTAQLVDGFQSNPYRGVWLGRTAAQEHHPDNRFRYAGSLAGRLWVEPLSGAISARIRFYRDNWDVRSITAQLSYEQTIDGALRIRAHARYYRQGGAAFFSDDYALRPRGQYFTGDRELSDQESFMAGVALVWTVTPGAEGDDLAPLSSLRLVLKADFMHHEFPDFRYARAAVPNTNAILGTLGLELVF